MERLISLPEKKDRLLSLPANVRLDTKGRLQALLANNRLGWL